MRSVLDPAVGAALPDALTFYLDVHRHPELSGHERRTAARFADRLGAIGFTVTSGVGGNGVVGVLENGDGPAVLIRAELDALPIQEDTGLSYASAEENVMHACGHDVHLAAVLGAAEVLARTSDRWSGRLVVVGQPAEETLDGAVAMLADGLYDRFGLPDVALAQHVAPFPAGYVAHTSGGQPVLAASAALRIVVTGTGGHVGAAAAVGNPIDVAARLVRDLPSAGPAGTVITTGLFHAGVAVNVVPVRAVLHVSVRAVTVADRDAAVAAVTALARRAEATVEVVTASDPTVPDDVHASLVRREQAAVLGATAVLPWSTSMATEDFPHFAAGGRVPLVYWMLGCISPARWESASGSGLPANHSPRFAPDAVPTLRAGVTAMTAAVLACLGPLDAEGDCQ